MRYTQPELLDHLASSYVLGTLQGGARRRFERLRSDRADVQMRVTQWEIRLGELAISIPPEKPSAKLWPAIAARTQPAKKPQPLAPLKPPAWLGWLMPAGFGFGGLAAGVVAATALFFLAPTLFVSSEQIAMRSGERLPPSYVGLLTDAAGNGKVLVSSLRHGKTMTVKIIGPIMAQPAGHMVLWAYPAEGLPFAVGIVPATGSAVSNLPDTSEKLFSKVSKLSITLETDAAPASPQGPVLFSGNCAKLW
ncbi:anti-sigma factor [Rhodoferax sp. AJA081-3]|uniref:anti-sigma factor n=1 Tax=Rhodoferax sp. AJA081-3 TaxID=2752316 RepID=UPI001ADFCC1F|nr:anti-sigma factor [Rhodoferax sp. AJA081-3]QTN27530.1 anti-sigma factor [Rhodoferax sp. AJA081-3]